MKLQGPAGGVIAVRDEAAGRYLAAGYTKVAAERKADQADAPVKAKVEPERITPSKTKPKLRRKGG